VGAELRFCTSSFRQKRSSVATRDSAADHPTNAAAEKVKYFAKSTYVLTPFAIQINAGVDAREGFGHVSATECNSLQHKQKDVSSVWSDKRQERMSQKAWNVTPQKMFSERPLQGVRKCPQMSAPGKRSFLATSTQGFPLSGRIP